MSDFPPGEKEIFAAIKANPARFRRAGWILIAVGVFAVVFPLLASIAVKSLIGWVFLVTGAVLLWHAFQSRDWKSALMSALIGIVHLAAGVYLAFFPLTGLIGLTALMALVLLVQAAAEMTIAFQHRPGEGWIWLAISGLASGLLGVLLLAGLPSTALWAIGLMLGLNALTSGVSFLALTRSV